MKHCKLLCALLLVASLSAAGVCGAAETTVQLGVAVGNDSAMAYTLQVRQAYEPWIGNSAVELKPIAELAGFVWTKSDDTVGGVSLAPGLMLTLFSNASFQPYLSGSVGGAAITDDKLHNRDLGSHFLFKSKAALGVEFGESLRHRIQGEYTNYSNWGLSDTNDGFNTYGISYGYSF